MSHDSTTHAPGRPGQDLVASFLESSTSAMHARVGGGSGVAVSILAGRGPRTLAASTDLAAEVDRVQFEVGTGPCLTALTTAQPLYVPDLAADDRWGDYGSRAAERGVRSCISLPVLVGGHAVAVFKVYDAQVDGLSERQRDVAGAIAQELVGGFALAAHVAAQDVELDDLTALMVHRRVIDLALGISMERAQVPSAAAFDLLRRGSQLRNVKLHEVAEDVVRSIPGTDGSDLVPPYESALAPTLSGS